MTNTEIYDGQIDEKEGIPWWLKAGTLIVMFGMIFVAGYTGVWYINSLRGITTEKRETHAAQYCGARHVFHHNAEGAPEMAFCNVLSGGRVAWAYWEAREVERVVEGVPQTVTEQVLQLKYEDYPQELDIEGNVEAN